MFLKKTYVEMSNVNGLEYEKKTMLNTYLITIYMRLLKMLVLVRSDLHT